MLIITHKYTIINGCVGKKTAQFDKLIATLLQTLVLCRLARFANVLFRALAVSDNLSLVAKTQLCQAAIWPVYN